MIPFHGEWLGKMDVRFPEIQKLAIVEPVPPFAPTGEIVRIFKAFEDETKEHPIAIKNVAVLEKRTGRLEIVVSNLQRPVHYKEVCMGGA